MLSDACALAATPLGQTIVFRGLPGCEAAPGVFIPEPILSRHSALMSSGGESGHKCLNISPVAQPAVNGFDSLLTSHPLSRG